MGKTEITLLALIAITAIALYSMEGEKKKNSEFELWKNKFGKQYSSTEETYRLGIWLKNVELIEEHNRRYKAEL